MNRISLNFTLGAAAPDAILNAQIDSRPLTISDGSGSATIGMGDHTASWVVISPTVRPLKFSVSIQAGGKTVLDRPDEQTGSDGKGVGVDEFKITEGA